MYKKEIYELLKKHSVKSNTKSIIQIINTVIPYFAIIASMIWLLLNGYSYFIVLALGVVAAGFLVRIFIIFHDCTHGSFFKSKLWCRIVGHFCGILTFTAFFEWQHAHNHHHGTTSNLQKRGYGDMWMMTTQEYYAASTLKKLWYRLYRNPIFLFIIAPPFKFFILNRIPATFKWDKYLLSQLITSSGIALIIILASYTIGFKNYLLIQVPVMSIAGTFGIWLFFIQHQFEDAYWANTDDRDTFRASMEGSSYYKLPALFRWFSGNIGYHHIHHLLANIPNYNLRKCYNEIEDLHKVNIITIRKSLRSMILKLYDEDTKKLVSYKRSRELLKSNTISLDSANI